MLGARRIRELLDERGIRLTKTLGQNFVIDPNTIRKMVEVAGVGPGDHVLEIGAGAGSLTLGLAATGARVTALELDERLLPILAETLAGAPGVEVVAGDALRFDYSATDANVMVANLPYNIAATVVIQALQEGSTLRRLTVMIQREVAERLASSPGSKIYGQTSLLVAFHGVARLAGTVSRNAFYPVPNVDSSIVVIERSAPPDVDEDLFRAVVKAGFGQRRKTLRSGLAVLAGSSVAATDLLGRAGVNPGARAESLDLDAFVRIARAFESRGE